MANEFKPTAFEGRRDRSPLLAAKSHAPVEPAAGEKTAEAPAKADDESKKEGAN